MTCVDGVDAGHDSYGMEIANLSKLRDSLAALEAVLARQVDQIVNLGDICSEVISPRETADRIIAHDLLMITNARF